MDFQLYLRVLWRFRLIVGAGFLLAASLAFLSVVRVDPGGSPLVQYREDEQWVTFSMLFVTQQGFPWGRLTTGDEQAQKAQQAMRRKSDETMQFEDPARFSNLAVLYAYLATSDPVRELMRRQGPVLGEIAAEPVMTSGTFASPMPLVRIVAIAKTPELSRALVIRTTDAFRQFLAAQQARNGIPEEQRVLVTVVKRADESELLAGRSLTLPIVVFLGVMILVSGLVFVLENMLGRGGRHAASEADTAPPVAVARDAA